MEVALKHSTFAHVPHEVMFHVCRGDNIDNIKDLANCIESLSNDQFHYHVNDKKNDFAKWVNDILKNPGLAKDLHFDANVKDKKQYVKTIRDHLAWLEKM